LDIVDELIIPILAFLELILSDWPKSFGSCKIGYNVSTEKHGASNSENLKDDFIEKFNTFYKL